MVLTENKVDKKVAGIIRWLERFKKSCSAGAIENALMDAECARADLENLRLDVWASLDPKTKKENKIFPRFVNFARIGSLAAAIIMLTSVPLSTEIKAAVIEHKKENLTLAKPIIIIRENNKPEIKAEIKNDEAKEIKNENENKNYAVKPKKSARTAIAKKPQTAQAKIQEKTKTEKTEAKPEQKQAQKTVAYDKVFSLVRTGERALKNDRSIIKNKQELGSRK